MDIVIAGSGKLGTMLTQKLAAVKIDSVVARVCQNQISHWSDFNSCINSEMARRARCRWRIE